MRGTKATLVSMQGQKRMFATSKEAYIWLLDRFIANRPDILKDDRQRDRIVTGRGRIYLAQTPKELFLASPHLADDPIYFARVSGGWFAITNLNNDVKFNVLCRFARIAGFDYGKDWTWDDGSNRKRPASPIDLKPVKAEDARKT